MRPKLKLQRWSPQRCGIQLDHKKPMVSYSS